MSSPSELEGVPTLRSGEVTSGDGAADSRASERMLQRGETLGRYLVLSRLGGGGMGIVYAAFDPELDRKVAVKLLLPGGASPTRGRNRLLREARAMARLLHPHVVAVFDVGTVGEQVYVAMELVSGETIAKWMRARRPWPEVVAMFVQAGRGLAAAHAEGLVHRDFKPDNVMVDDRGHAKVMDFGLVRATQLPESEPEGDQGTPDDLDPLGLVSLSAKMTGDSVLLGTPAYMAPEQFTGATADARSDQFSFCAALWEGLTGARPYAGDDVPTLLQSLGRNERRPFPPDRQVPASVRRAVERGLSIDPAARWPSMDALLDALAPAPRRRVWLWSSAAAATTGLAIAAAVWLRSDAELCGGANEALAVAWNDDRRARAEEAVLGTGAAFAAGTWDRVAPAIDAWASEWTTMHTDACEATHRRHEQSEAAMDLRMTCLLDARRDLSAVVDVLEDSTPAIVARAEEIVAELPELSRCADLDALTADVAPPPPELAEAVAKIEVDVAEAHARVIAEEPDAALAAVERAEAAMADVDYEPLRAELFLLRGIIQDDRGNYEEAVAALNSARDLGTRSRQWPLVRDATTELMEVLAQLARPAEALVLREFAMGLAIGSPEAEAQVHSVLADVHQAAGDYAAAETEQRAALALQQSVLGPDDLAISRTRNNLATVLHERGRDDEAEAELRAALEVRVRALGPEHPRVATTRTSLAVLLGNRGDASAEAEFRDGIAVYERTFGPDHPDTAGAHLRFGAFLLGRLRVDEGKAEFETALAVLDARLGPAHPETITARNGLAGALRAQGRLAESVAELRAVVVAFRDALGPEHPNVATARNNLGTVLSEQGEHAEAAEELRAALDLRVATLGSDHPHVVQTRYNLARALVGLGKDEEAEPELRAALAYRIEKLGEVPETAGVMVALGELLVRRGRAGEALELLERAWKIVDVEGTDPVFAGRAAFALARALVETRASRARARSLAERALQAFTTAGSPMTREREAVENWLRTAG